MIPGGFHTENLLLTLLGLIFIIGVGAFGFGLLLVPFIQWWKRTF